MSTLRIVEYAAEHKAATAGLMAELQEVERALSTDRTEGFGMADEHVDYLLSLCQAQSGRTFVALSGEEVVGFAVVFIEAEDEEDHHLLPEYKRYGWLSDLYVKPAHRGGAVAAGLVEAAERHCAAQGVRRMLLSVLHDNSGARRFYEKSGYRLRDVVYCKDL